MTRETKVGLLFGMALILVVGILVSDFLVEPTQPAAMTDFGDQAQRGSMAMAREVVEPTASNPPQLPVTGAAIRDTAAPPRNDLIDQPRSDDRLPPSATARAEDHAGASPFDRQLSLDETLDRSRNLTRREPLTGRSRSEPVDAGNTYSREDTQPIVRHDPRPDLFHTPEQLREIRPVNVDHQDRTTTEARQNTANAARQQRLTHTVGDGEALYQIATRYYRDGEKWRLIRDANPNLVGRDGQVRAGVELVIPVLEDLTQMTQFEQVASDRSGSEPAADGRFITVTVREGQVLSQIAAEQLGSSRRWPEILEANRDQLPHERALRAGMEIRIPRTSGTASESRPSVSEPPASNRTAQPSRREYVVQPGDNLYRIAAAQLGDGERWRDILEVNRDRIRNENSVPEGITLVLP